jgi:hypothetical protein
MNIHDYIYLMDNPLKNNLKNNLKINIIGFSGKINSGKNYIGEQILGKQLHEQGYRVHSLAFGDQIKYEIACRSTIVNKEIIDYNILLNENYLYNKGFGYIINNVLNGTYPVKHVFTYFKALFRTLCDFIGLLFKLNYFRKYYENNLTNENIYNLVFNEKPIPIRLKLQNHANERNIDENIWVNSLHLKIIHILEKSYDKSKDVFIITDVRFKNEINFIKKMGGIVIRITPSNKLLQNNYNNENEKKINSHISEIELDDYKDYDSVIVNTFDDNVDIKSILNLIF